jgi:membrane fusion protein, multidrug efflux system
MQPSYARRRCMWLPALAGCGLLLCLARPSPTQPGAGQATREGRDAGKARPDTVWTDDAYVNGHATSVAPRAPGQVTRVLVDDNYRVKKGDVLVELDKEPYQVQVQIKKAAVEVATTNLLAAQAQVRGQVAHARANRFKLEQALEDVNNQIANLRARVASLESKKATLRLTQANLKRGEELAPVGGISKEELDRRRQTAAVAQADVDQALHQVYVIRARLRLPNQPPGGRDPAEVPPDLEQNASAVRAALADLAQTMARIGRPLPRAGATPQQVLEDFKQLYARADSDAVLKQLVSQAPAVKQAEAKLLQAQSNLDRARLNLTYCEVVSAIDGIVTRRSVNPGDYVRVGQSLMAVRSLREIWIDANFKETQLAELRIGQRVKVAVDMYAGRKAFNGRITGFTMDTGRTPAPLPPEGAGGKRAKVVQRLPVRIELTDYDPEGPNPLFIGLSCTAHVYYQEPPTGPHAGKYLQPLAPRPRAPTEPGP